MLWPIGFGGEGLNGWCGRGRLGLHRFLNLDVWRRRDVGAARVAVLGRRLWRHEFVIVGDTFEILDRTRHSDPQGFDRVTNSYPLGFEVRFEFCDVTEKAGANVLKLLDFFTDWLAHGRNFGLR